MGSLFTRGFRLCPPLRTAHPHAGPGAHALHCSAQSPGAGPRVAMPWEALSPAIYPLPSPSLTCCQSAVTSLNWTVGRFISPLSHLDQEGELCSMAVGLCWLPLRHPLHAPAPALYWGMMPLTPVSTASSWTQDALITPLPPHSPTVTRTRWFKLGARHLAVRCPLGRQRSTRQPRLPQMPSRRRHHLPVG